MEYDSYKLKSHVNDIFSFLPSSTKLLDITDYIYGQYMSYNRYYHNQCHIFDLLSEFTNYLIDNPKQPHQNEIKMALLLHDIIYDIPCLDTLSNEQKSAAAFEKIVEVVPELNKKLDCKIVKNLILSTQYTDPNWCATKDSHIEFQIVHDLDFSPMGNKYDSFIIDSINIRKEYWYVPKKVFYAGREAFLKNLLEKDELFLTDYFKDKYEDQARSNINQYNRWLAQNK